MKTLVIGARGSPLSVAQTRAALAFLETVGPDAAWRLETAETPGDRDLKTPLEESAPDFFTRDLDEAVLSGRFDAAVHSAKDLPGYAQAGLPMVRAGLDWFWLPDRADARDAWVYRAGERPAAGSDRAVIGVSSARRRAYAQKCFPHARLEPIRGAIDARLAQLAQCRFDAVLMAVAGLRRLYGGKLPEGIVAQPVDERDLPPPEAQGYLAVTFRAGDPFFTALRERLVKAVRFVSAGVGDAALCTIRGLRDIARADVVLYDALMGDVADFRALVAAHAPDGACPRFLPVGKRCGAHSMAQADISRALCDEARKMRRVVRLKGGDAGLFGRLTEETDALSALHIPFVVRPGVSALTAATTATGLILTRRGVSRGFTALTPRSNGADMPIVCFMAVRMAAEEGQKLLAAGRDPATPCAVVFDAAGPRESIWRGTLADLAASGAGAAGSSLAPYVATGLPGLVIIGSAADALWPAWGPLGGQRILVTASAEVGERVACVLEDRGAHPVAWPLIRLVARPNLPDATAYDAVVFTSPAAVRLFFASFSGDRRRLPAIYTCGAGTDRALRTFGLAADLAPREDFSARGLIAEIDRLSQASPETFRGKRILRLRSALAGGDVADALRRAGAAVDDAVAYNNEPVVHDGALPPCDGVHFASASAVTAFLSQYGAEALAQRTVFVMGEPTREALPEALRKTARVLRTW